MSGGRFNYDQRRIGYIAEAIIDEINKSGRKKLDRNSIVNIGMAINKNYITTNIQMK
jgi:hypothetical protein